MDDFPRNSACISCSLHTAARSVCVPTRHHDPSLPPSADVPILFVIGQNPGPSEDRACRAYVGDSLVYLEDIYFGLPNLPSICCIYLTNAARCGPSEVKPSQSNRCLPLYTIPDLHQVLAPHNPKVHFAILLLGGVASASFYHTLTGTGLSATEAIRINGSPLTICDRPIPIFTTWNPAALLRNQSLLMEVTMHMQLVRDFFDGIMAVPSRPTFIPPRYPQ